VTGYFLNHFQAISAASFATYQAVVFVNGKGKKSPHLSNSNKKIACTSNFAEDRLELRTDLKRE